MNMPAQMLRLIENLGLWAIKDIKRTSNIEIRHGLANSIGLMHQGNICSNFLYRNQKIRISFNE